jgi:hypothetical protein
MTFARIAIRLEYARWRLANLRARWDDFRTAPLSGDEWVDLGRRFPKLFKHYERGILTAGETARNYRDKIAWIRHRLRIIN